ncbi:hypothetical protein ACFWMJ_36295 [Streptomyces hawaiiensis]|uniref:hypothetical protein n=1 Tax=Streptomyces hawaiiensis TaxID=67305 RepID=UPI00366942D3
MTGPPHRAGSSGGDAAVPGQGFCAGDGTPALPSLAPAAFGQDLQTAGTESGVRSHSAAWGGQSPHQVPAEQDVGAFVAGGRVGGVADQEAAFQAGGAQFRSGLFFILDARSTLVA